jgi:formylglycine-generating enzyme required for sulfatase activity
MNPLRNVGSLLHEQYRVLEVLHAGRRGALYRVEETRLRQAFLIRHLYARSEAPQRDERSRRARERFRSMSGALLELRHPRVATVIDTFDDDNSCYIVLDVADGRTMAQVVGEAVELLDEPPVLSWANDLCEALGYLHARPQRMVVGNLEPELIWITNDNEAILPIFGLARLYEAEGGLPDPRVDVYGLGRTLYYAFTRILPPDAKERLLHLQDDGADARFAPLHTINAHVTMRTELGVEKMLELEPSRRPADMNAVRRLLLLGTPALDGGGDTIIPMPSRTRPEVPARADAAALPAASAAPQPPPSAPAPPAAATSESSLSAETRLPVPIAPPVPPAGDRPEGATERLHESTLEAASREPGPTTSVAPMAKMPRAVDRPLDFRIPSVVLAALLLTLVAWVRIVLYAPDEARVRIDPNAAFKAVERSSSAGALPLSILEPRDTSIMLLVPRGSFRMGAAQGEADTRPPHNVDLPAFYLDRANVTIGQFEKFVEATNYVPQGPWKSLTGDDDPNRPVVGVTYDDADAYARWVNKRLPREAEWEKATYNGWIGAVDMTGRVWQWTSGDFQPYPGSTWRSPLYDMKLRVLRGGSFAFPKVPYTMRLPMAPSLWAPDIGFRCARDAANQKH